MFWSKLRYELPEKGNGTGDDGNFLPPGTNNADPAPRPPANRRFHDRPGVKGKTKKPPVNKPGMANALPGPANPGQNVKRPAPTRKAESDVEACLMNTLPGTLQGKPLNFSYNRNKETYRAPTRPRFVKADVHLPPKTAKDVSSKVKADPYGHARPPADIIAVKEADRKAEQKRVDDIFVDMSKFSDKVKDIQDVQPLYLARNGADGSMSDLSMA